ncbi:MAG: hypothetical protein ACLP1E_09195 [Acidimicrobiales bacterium]
MSAPTPDFSALLRWYPSRWRARYGEELAAMVEDSLDGRSPTHRLRFSIAWAGLRERGHETGMLGDTTPAADRVRTGSLLVLCAWAAFVVAGASFAKIAENFDLAVPVRSQALSTDSYYSLCAGALIAGTLVLAGAAIAVPAFARFLRAGGWRSIRGHVLRAATATVVAVVAVLGLVALARTLTPEQRNGDLLYHSVVWYYLVPFVLTMLVIVATLALWTVAAVVVARRLELSRRVLSVEAALAVAVAVTMPLMTAATALWWGAVASGAPWFIQGARPGSSASAFSANLAATMALMLVACAVAGFGLSRVARAWGRMQLD